MLSYRSTDLGAFMPLIQQKRLVTGKEEGTRPQTVRMGAAMRCMLHWRQTDADC
jgi:hypothetical protein